MADDHRRRSSWPWRKLKLSSLTSKAGDKSTRFSPSPLISSPASTSFKAEESARFHENSWKQEGTCSTAKEDAHVRESAALREKAEESLRALKQEVNTLMKELTAKEAVVKQHQKVADEAVSGWEKAEKEVLSLKRELEAASKRKATQDDRIAQLDGALKECMRQVRHVRDEQEVKIQEVIKCKTRELAEVKADMDTKQEELQRRLMESDAQNSAMAKSLQERARRILEANEAKSKTEAELKVMQVNLGSAEKDISSLQYELHLLSKELEIRNEEVAYCKKSADAAHKQHLENVQKVAHLEADCQRLRILLKKKLPGPAAIAQMRKEVERLPTSLQESATAEVKRRSSRSYASNTISFANSHQRGTASNSNRDVDMLRDRLISMDEENKLLKEALSKRIGELQSSWLLCAKTASKLSIAEDHLESLQGTPRDHAKTDRSFDFTVTPSIASVSDVDTQFGGHDDVEEASCAESWASALIGELAHFKREKIITKEAIKEVTEPYTSRESSSSAHVVHHEVLHEEKCPVVDDMLPKGVLQMGNVLQHQHNQVKALSLLCKELDHKLVQIQEVTLGAAGNGLLENEKLIGLVDAAQKTFSELEKKIQGLKTSLSMQSMAPDSNAPTTIMSSEKDESGSDVGMQVPMRESIVGVVERLEGGESNLPAPMSHMAPLQCQKDELKMDAHTSLRAGVFVKDCDTIEKEKHDVSYSSSLASVLSKLITLLEMLPRRTGDATLDADCAGWKREKLALGACKDRFLQGKASVLEILIRLGKLVCRACQVGSADLEHMLASIINADMGAQEVSVNAAGFLRALPGPRQVEGGDEVGNESNKPEELEADVITSGADRDELNAGPNYEPRDEVDADVVAADELRATLDDVDADVARGNHRSELAAGVAPNGELAADVARDAELNTDVASKLAQMQSDKERLCEEGAMKTAELEEAQAQLSHFKLLHTQLETKNEELQLKLQGLQVEDDGCNAVKLLDIGEGLKHTKDCSDLVDAKEKLAECERTMLDLGKQLHALSSSSTARSLPRHRFLHDNDEPELSRQRGLRPGCHVVSGPQDSRSLQRPASPHSHQQVKARRQRYAQAADWLQQLDEPDGQYSPPRSAMSSPARSPGRYAQQVSGRTRGSGVRTSLTESLNAAANKYSGRPPTPSGGTSSFGTLFSRSRNHC